MSEDQRIEVYRMSPPSVRPCSGKTCSKRVEWVLTPKGKWMPLTHPVSVISQHEMMDGRVMSIVASSASHFSSCPDAELFRRRRK